MRPFGFMGRFVVLMAIVASGSCGGPTSPSQGAGGNQNSQGLTSSWQATRAEFISSANSNVRIEVVSRGTTVALVLDAAGTYTRTITDPGQTPDVETGTWSASQDVLTLRPTGMPFSIEFNYSLNNTTLTLSGGHVEFDVNGDGMMEEAILNLTLTRR